MPGLSILQAASVQPGTLGKYLKRFELFKKWLGGRSPETEEEWDLALVELSDDLFMNNKAAGVGQKTLAATMFLNPKVARNKGSRFPLARMSLRGWGRLVPTTSRLPVAYEC